MPLPILQTKLFIPRSRPTLVSRGPLMARLMDHPIRPLTLVSAPAGFGKTTLVSEWSRLHVPPALAFCWLTLDEEDNDVVRFLLYLVAALQTVDPHLGRELQTILAMAQAPPLHLLLTHLLNDLETTARPLVLVLDDYHVITAQPVHNALTFLVENLPPTLHLVVTTRIDPPLPLARWRVRNQLTEVRAGDLRFTADEARVFFNERMELALTATEIDLLGERTEGWIAALQLAALSMQGRADRADFITAFAGSHRFIIDYLTEEVLGHQPPAIRDFLLVTSILERVCGDLGDALTHTSTGQATLEYLEQRNLFLIPLDDERGWYRYHHLFADVLRLNLQQAQPHVLPALHQSAQTWLAQHGWLHEAVHHALAGRDFGQAAQWIEQIHGAKWQSGELETLQSWLAALPAEVWRVHPRLWLVQAWAAMTVGNFTEADPLLREAEAALAALDEATAQTLRPEVLAMRASYASLTQDPRAVELTQAALHDLPQDYWMRGMLIVFLAAAYYANGDLDAAIQVLSSVPNTLSATLAEQPHQVHLLAFGGMVHLAKGQLRKAWSLAQQALALAEPGDKPIPYVGTLMAYMATSLVLYEQGLLDQLEIYLTRCATLAVNFGSAEVQVFTLSGLARLCLAHGDLAGALHHYRQIDALLQTHAFNNSIIAYVEYHRFQLLLQQGNLSAAAAWVEEHSDQPRPLNSYAFHRLALPQVLLAWGDTKPAQAQLARLIQEAEATGHGTLLLKALVLQALAWAAGGDNRQALTTLTRALTLAEPEGYIRVFVDAGEPMHNMLRTLRLTLTDVTLRRYTDRLLAAFTPPPVRSTQPMAPPPSESAQSSVPQPLIEPLSDREREILHLVADGLSNSEIAAKLIVTVGTVKKHLNNIYGKLGIGSRTQAIARGRELQLL